MTFLADLARVEITMVKRIILSAMLLPLVFTFGCAEIEGLTDDLTKSPKSPKILRAATIESEWAMKQIEVTVVADEEVEILLKLADQDEVDGYFYIEDGSITDFQVTGNSLIYSAQAQAAPEPGGISSARFSFVATKAQGTTYTLTFSNTGDGDTRTKETVFMEIIYPTSGSLFIPVETD